jgi:hypothetical protein
LTFTARLFAAMLLCAALTAPARGKGAAIQAMQDYMEVAPYEAGIILPQQLAKDVFESVAFIDTRDAAQLAEGSIPGVRNIEWREVLGFATEQGMRDGGAGTDKQSAGEARAGADFQC